MAYVERASDLKGPVGLRVCGIALDTAKSLNVVSGDIIEIIKGDGAPLRCWARVIRDAKAQTVQLDPTSIGLAGIGDGEKVYLRPLKTPAGIAAKIWRERIEVLS